MINQIKKFANKNSFCERLIYIAYRILTLLYSALFLICRIFPVEENKIVCCNMKGKRYGDNPKYILDEIIRQGLDYKMVWLMKDKADSDLPLQVKRAAYNPFSIAYHLSTAKIWIDSNMKEIGTLKRRNQYYIQTWHGSPSLKRLALDIETKNSLFSSKPYIYNAKIEDLMLSNCESTSEMFRRAFVYKGKILKCGCPRNDLFFKDVAKYKNKVESYFSIENKKIILYAPTFRNDFSVSSMNLNFDKVIKVCEQCFGGNWVVLVRLHPNNIQAAKGFMKYTDNIINATGYNIMQELLAASDALITDYSSSMFDFAISQKPCFIYATDIEKYRKERDFYFDIMELPFPVAQNNDEMMQNIKKFDDQKYKTKLNSFFKKINLFENGTASSQVVDYIKNL